MPIHHVNHTIEQFIDEREVILQGVLVEILFEITLEDVDHGIQECKHESCKEPRVSIANTCVVGVYRCYAQAFALDRVTATKNISLCRMYRNVLPSMLRTGAAEPASLAAITCMYKMKTCAA